MMLSNLTERYMGIPFQSPASCKGSNSTMRFGAPTWYCSDCPITDVHCCVLLRGFVAQAVRHSPTAESCTTTIRSSVGMMMSLADTIVVSSMLYRAPGRHSREINGRYF